MFNLTSSYVKSHIECKSLTWGALLGFHTLAKLMPRYCSNDIKKLQLSLPKKIENYILNHTHGNTYQYSTTSQIPDGSSLTDRLQCLQLHTQAVHPAGDGGQPQGQHQSSRGKVERPTLKSGVDQAEWSHFEYEWDNYKTAMGSQAPPPRLTCMGVWRKT